MSNKHAPLTEEQLDTTTSYLQQKTLQEKYEKIESREQI